MTALDTGRWEARLAELAREHDVPGASLAVLAEGRVHTAVTGVLNVETGVEVTPNTLFAIGSIAKVYTATAVMRLVETGQIDLNAPVTEVLPSFRVADPDVTRRVTPRHLLTHTSGISGDAFIDTGCGDDAVQRFVESLGNVGQDLPLGASYSYCNTGFVILGRMIEQLTGQCWDAALRELVLDPIGLSHTTTRLEHLVRFRATCGHVGGPGAVELEPERSQMRGHSPAGSTMYASAADVVAFGRVFLDGGVARNGTQVLSADSVAEMLRPQVPVAVRWTEGDHRGLGWTLFDWDGRRVLEHGGGTPGHRSYFEVVPDRGVAIALLTNGRNAFAGELYRELLRELCELERPTMPQPAPDGGPVAADGIAGRYVRFGVQVDVELRDGALHTTERLTDPLASLFPQMEAVESELRPSTAGAGVFVTRAATAGEWKPVVFEELAGVVYLHLDGRGHQRVA
jgi:CubicO group peptidase (beta-lactamase class C family)